MPFDLSQLNQEQLRAVQAQNKIVIVKAGPGTGKTHTLSAKLITLLEEGTNPKQIAALTFTQRAAQEMKERLSFRLCEQSTKPFIGTFHAFSLQQLKINPEKIIKDNQRQKILLQTKIDLGQTQLNLQDIELIITQSKNQALTLQLNDQVKRILDIYSKHLKTAKKLDYDDLLLKLSKQISQEQLIKYLLIDEFQDLNKLQLEIVDKLLPNLKQLFVIGDINQAIYGFRGAQAKGLVKWAEKFPEAKTILLKKNYRSDQKILDTAATLFPNQKKLVPVSCEQGEVKLIKTLNQFSEANFIKTEIEKKVGGIGLLQASECHQVKEAKFSDFAVIYRTKFIARQIKKELDQAGIPVQQVGTDSIYLQPEISFLVNLIWWSALVEEKNKINISTEEVENNLLQSLFLSLSLKLIIKFEALKRESKSSCLLDLLPLLITGGSFSQKQQDSAQSLLSILQKLEKKQAKKDLIQLVEQIIMLLREQFNLKDSQLKNIYQFKANLLIFSNQENQIKNFYQYLQELKLRDYFDHQADRVSLLTMHAAKGLEFDWVYLIGFEQGSIPMVKKDKFASNDTVADITEEEKRLFYVAVTRAKRGLFLIKPEYRWKKKLVDSRFFNLIKNKIEIITDESLIKFRKKQKEQELRSRQSSLF